MRCARYSNDPFRRAGTRLVNCNAGSRVATNLADPGATFADYGTGQLLEIKMVNFTPDERYGIFHKMTYVFRNGHLRCFSVAAVVFAEHALIVIHTKFI